MEGLFLPLNKSCWNSIASLFTITVSSLIRMLATHLQYTFQISIPATQSFWFSGNCLSNIKLLLTIVVCLYNGIFLLNKLVINIFINYYNLISIEYLSTIYNILLYKINKNTVEFNLKIFTNSVLSYCLNRGQ